MKKIFQSIISIILILIFLGTDTSIVLAAVNATSIKLNATEVQLAVVDNATIGGKKYRNTYQLTATISPSNTSDKTVTWSSYNSNKVSVDKNGKITAKAAGTTTIVAKTANGKTATCKVTVVLNTNDPGGARFGNILNSTVWTTQKTNIYKEVGLKNTEATVDALTEAIIIDTNNASNANNYIFKIKTVAGKVGWINPNYLMINLPDVRSDIKYNITNAYSSIFKIGSSENKSQIKEYNQSQTKDTQYTSGYVKIDGLTGKQLYTYDNDGTIDGKVYNPKLERYEFVAPALYKFALQIGVAQNMALQNGYCLKIYDSYRPQTDVCNNFWQYSLNAYNNSQKARYLVDATVNGSSIHGLAWFVAAKTSDHARGVAIDVTMVFKDNISKEISSQSDMHDLSTNSLKVTNAGKKANVSDWNTSYTDLLHKIMTSSAVNMEPLPSEWWHFNIKNRANYTAMYKNITYTDKIAFNNPTVSYNKNIDNPVNENVTVTITANKQIKTKPSDWSYVANSSNKKISKVYSSSASASNVTIKDYSGNSKTVSIKKITIDKVKPTITKVTATGTTSSGNKTVTNTYSNNKLSGSNNIENTWFKDNVTLKIEATDTSGIKSYWISGTKGQSKTISSTTSGVKLTVYDNAENLSYVTVNVKIDKTKPTLSLTSDKGVSTWVNPSKTTSYIVLNPKDTGGSTLVDSYEISTDNKTWETKTTKSGDNLVYKITKNETVYFRVKDKAGNYSDVKSVKISKVDKTNPTISSVVGGNGALTIKASDSESGLKSYTIDGKTWKSWPSGRSEVVENKENATINSGTIKVQDTVGNITSWNNQVKTGVTIKFKTQISYSTTSLTKNNVTVTITLNKKILSSSVPSGWTLSSDGLKLTKIYTTNTISSGENYTLIAEETQESSIVNVKIQNIDKTEPTVNVTGNPSNWTKEATITVNASDANGIAGYSFNNGSYTVNNTYTVSSNGNLIIKVKDKVGNVKQVTEKIEYIDKVAPKVSITGPSYSKDKQTATIQINAQDDQTGLKEYSLDGGKTWKNWPATTSAITLNYTSNQTIAAETIQIKDNADNIAKYSSAIYIKYIDNVELKLQSPIYSQNEPTNKDILVLIRANKEIKAPEGWTIYQDDNKVIFKTYTQNTKVEGETVEVEDANTGIKVLSEKVIIQNIDKIAPIVKDEDITYTALANGLIKVTVKANEELVKISNTKNGLGTRWTVDSEDKRVISAEFSVSKHGNIIIEDKAGNTASVNINIPSEFTSLNPEITYKEINGTEEVEIDEQTQTNKNVKVIIKVDREISDVANWTKSQDGKQLERVYDNYAEETITLIDKLNTNNKENVIISVNIDKQPPTINVRGNPENWTKNANLIVDGTDNRSKTIKYSFNGGEYSIKRTYAITENNVVTIKAKDEAGNESEEVKVNITKFDNKVPIINDEDIVKIVSEDKQTVTIQVNARDEGESGICAYSFDNGFSWQEINTYQYNGNQTIEAGVIQVKDNAGNIGIYNKEIIIQEIDDSVFKIVNISYTTKAPTKENVTVTVRTNKPIKEVEGWNLNEDGMSIYKEYTNNTSETGESVTVTDANTGKTITYNKIIVNNIDRIKPVINENDITYSKISNKKVQVTIKANEELQEMDEWELIDNTMLRKVYFENTQESGEKLVIKDLAGNETEVTVKITSIVENGEEPDDGKSFNINIMLNPFNITNTPVKVTVTVDREVILSDETKTLGWTLLADGKTIEKTFNNNNSEEITLIDAEDTSYEESIVIDVENIDMTKPNLSIQYEKIEDSKVKVTIISDKKMKEKADWELSEDGYEFSKIYEQETEEKVKFQDLVGNEQEITIKVKPEIKPVISEGLVKNILYSPTSNTDKPVTVTITLNEEINPVENWELSENKKELKRTFNNNYTGTITLVSAEDNEYIECVEINVNNIVKNGDINQNGKTDIGDLLLLKRHLISKNKPSWSLIGESLNSADINGDGKVNVIDLLLLKRNLIQI